MQSPEGNISRKTSRLSLGLRAPYWVDNKVARTHIPTAALEGLVVLPDSWSVAFSMEAESPNNSSNNSRQLSNPVAAS